MTLAEGDPAIGYAVRQGRQILINTVSETERAAKVNGLVVVFHITPRNSWTDAQIDDYWEAAVRGDLLNQRLANYVELIRVVVFKHV